MPHGVDAAVEAVQASREHSLAHRLAAQSERHELHRAHHSVLPRSNPCELHIAIGAFVNQRLTKAPIAAFSSPYCFMA
jgi:hypothetical protein